MHGKLNLEKGGFSHLSMWINQMEKEQAAAKEAEFNTLEEYFDDRNRKRLSTMRISEMNNDDIYHLDNYIKEDAEKKSNKYFEIRKGVDDVYHDPGIGNPDPAEQLTEILEVLQQCKIVASKNKPEYVPFFEKLEQLFSQLKLGNSELDNTNIQHCNRRKKISKSEEIIKACIRANDIKKY